MNHEIEKLNDRFGIPGLTFESANDGLTRAIVNTPAVKGELYLHGAHVTGFQPVGHSAILWMSENSFFEIGKPIRGGVPLCFPWFGPNPKDAHAPAHGLARTRSWNCSASSRLADDGIALELSANIAGYSLKYRAEFGSSLRLALQVELTPDVLAPQSFEEALHTYFSIGDIRQVDIEGLESCDYLDKVGGLTKRSATHEAIRFSGETDRVYLDAKNICVLNDRKLQRAITIRSAGSKSTVVWNPWIDKSIKMQDFGDNEWPEMVCIETANVADHAITLEPGQIHTIATSIHVSNLP